MEFEEDILDISLLDSDVNLSRAESDVSNNLDKNIFFVGHTGTEHFFDKYSELIATHKNLYILTQKAGLNSDSVCKLSKFFNAETKLSELNELAEMCSLLCTDINFIREPSIKRGIIIVPAKYLEPFNRNNLALPESCLVYLMLQTSEPVVGKYIEMLNPTVPIEDYASMKIFTSYFRLKDNCIDNISLNRLFDNIAFKYWSTPSNNIVSTNNAFLNRKFNFTIKDEWKNTFEMIQKKIKKTIDKFPEKKPSNTDYVNGDSITPVENALSDSPILKRLKTKDIASFYDINDKIDVDTDIIECIFLSRTVDEQSKIKLAAMLLSSKYFFQIILHNEKIMSIIQPLLSKYLPVFKYSLSYAFVTMYLEELIRKTKIKYSDRNVFTLEEANRLPIFHFNRDNLNGHPYLPITLSNDNINYSGIFGVEFPSEMQQGIVDINEFRRRLNIFITGYENCNLLENINWSNMVVTGGCMAAIMPKYNPLFGKFENVTKPISHYNISEQAYAKFINEYYNDSDIDLACNHSNLFDFIQHVIATRNKLVDNYNKNYPKNQIVISDIAINPIKTVAIYINYQILKKKCESGEIPFNLDYILKNKHSGEIKSYFHKLYIDIKTSKYADSIKIISDRINEAPYASLVSICNISDITLVISDFDLGNSDNNRKPEYSEGYESMYSIYDSDTLFIRFTEILKYKISSKYLRNTFEIFRINDDDFFSCIARFHLGCVRSYYNGETCYLLPSSIATYHTLTNIDFKYFIGSKDPIQIINKYRMRGYSTLLNSTEIDQVVTYFHHVPLYRNLYGLTSDDIEETKNKVCGFQAITSNLFEPRKNTPFEYPFTQDPPVYLTPTKSTCQTNQFDKKYDSLLNLASVINSDGNIEVFKPWLIDALIDISKN